MSSPSTVLTGGLGTWGSVNELPTRGFGPAAVAALTGPGQGLRARMQPAEIRARQRPAQIRARTQPPEHRART